MTACASLQGQRRGGGKGVEERGKTEELVKVRTVLELSEPTPSDGIHISGCWVPAAATGVTDLTFIMSVLLREGTKEPHSLLGVVAKIGTHWQCLYSLCQILPYLLLVGVLQ